MVLTLFFSNIYIYFMVLNRDFPAHECSPQQISLLTPPPLSFNSGYFNNTVAGMFSEMMPPGGSSGFLITRYLPIYMYIPGLPWLWSKFLIAALGNIEVTKACLPSLHGCFPHFLLKFPFVISQNPKSQTSNLFFTRCSPPPVLRWHEGCRESRTTSQKAKRPWGGQG